MSKRRPSYIPKEQWIENLELYLHQLVFEYLPLSEWGFSLSSCCSEEVLIFRSPYCKVKFRAYWDGDIPGIVSYDLAIYYGRLHAPDRVIDYMEQQGERYLCWIRSNGYNIFQYLDTTFPRNGRRSYKDIFEEYWKRRWEFENGIHRTLAAEKMLWKNYAPELFYLFDLRRPELWERYRAWLRERYIAEGRNEAKDEKEGLIPYYRVC